MAVAELFALKQQLAPARTKSGSAADPKKRSLANTLRALRSCLCNLQDIAPLGQDLLTRLRLAVTDDYERKASKKARYRPPNPDKKPLGDPEIRKLTAEEKESLNALTAQTAA
jgi:hypothetical protein